MLALARANFGRLFDALHAEGYRVIGPTVRACEIAALERWLGEERLLR